MIPNKAPQTNAFSGGRIVNQRRIEDEMNQNQINEKARVAILIRSRSVDQSQLLWRSKGGASRDLPFQESILVVSILSVDPLSLQHGQVLPLPTNTFWQVSSRREATFAPCQQHCCSSPLSHRFVGAQVRDYRQQLCWVLLLDAPIYHHD